MDETTQTVKSGLTDVFISYSRQDILRVKPLVEALTGCGWNVWWDKKIPVGARGREVVKRQLSQARTVLAVISRNSIDSDWIDGELKAAMKKGTPIFPVLLDDVEPPIPLSGIQHVRFVGWSERRKSPRFGELVSGMALVLGPPANRQAEGAFPVHEFEDLGVPDEDDSKKIETEPFQDPTVPFPKSSGIADHEFDMDEVRTWADELLSHRLIAVRSPDDEITSAAVDSLVGLEEFSRYDIRLLAFGIENQKRSDLTLNNLAGRDFGNPNQATIVVVDSHGGLPFIESTLGSPHQARRTSEEMSGRDLLMVVQIGSRYQRELKPRFGNFRFPCCEVRFLEPLLLRYFSKEKAQVLHERLLRQRERNLWGPVDDDLEFYESLQALLSPRKERFEQALERRESDGVAEPETLVALETFRSNRDYCRGIILCAAFFRGLDVNEFKTLCLSIVGDRVVHVPDVSRGEGGRVLSSARRSTLREEWSNVADDLFEECDLVVRDSQGQHTVAFGEPNERKTVAQYIESRANYFSETASKLWATGIFFEEESSTELVDGMTVLFLAMLRHDRSLKRSEWLSDLLVARLSGGPPKDVEDWFKKLTVNHLVLGRTSRLLRALLVDADYARLVNRWLDDLLFRGGHLQALELTAHLHYVEGFDYLFWLKRFCDEGSKDVRAASYVALYRHAQQSGAQIWEFLSSLEDWLPDPSRSASRNLSTSNLFALNLIIHYSFDSANQLKSADIGCWPPRYPLFRDFALDAEAASQRLSSLMFWIFHPGVASLPSLETWQARGQLISAWAYILLGLEPEFTHAEAEKNYKRLIQLCLKHTNVDGRRKLHDVWVVEKQDYQNRPPGKGYKYFQERTKLLDRIIVDVRDAVPSQSRSAGLGRTPAGVRIVERFGDSHGQRE
ncbi:MAG TPA: toll/interleukin-1 receptor domain-containing protein [Acidobacteriota bacterium]|nr:toll/interleukin-1 receptor domain-containing protein [Acidobacteriota bacterium]